MSESTQLTSPAPRAKRRPSSRIGGASALRRRFVEMGIVKGETILIERQRPARRPCGVFHQGLSPCPAKGGSRAHRSVAAWLGGASNG
ncbi:MAG: ferrous iron transport protein A [Ignavibacteriales bacterium]|nr:ferrous iron transport protein A [Ignavibacteriales bacterium]